MFAEPGSGTPFKVRVGPLDRAAADAMVLRLRKEGFKPSAPYPLALLSGLLLVASFPKFGHPAFAWVSLAPLIVAVTLAAREEASTRRTFLLGVMTGVVYFAGTLYWIGGVMAVHGGLSPVLSYGLMVALALYLALFVGLFTWLLGRAVRQFGMTGVWLAPCLWVAAEWFRAWLGWEFPWVLLGSSQATVLPVVQLASVTGVYGLSALVALVGTAAAALALSRRPVHRRGALAGGRARRAAGRRGRVARVEWRARRRRHADAGRACCRATCRRTPSGIPRFVKPSSTRTSA